MPDEPLLMVPVHLDVLVLDADRAVVDATADFARLPYCDGVRDVNGDVAHLGEELVADPFAGQDLRLPAGVHLRWALPDALTRAVRLSTWSSWLPPGCLTGTRMLCPDPM